MAKYTANQVPSAIEGNEKRVLRETVHILQRLTFLMNVYGFLYTIYPLYSVCYFSIGLHCHALHNCLGLNINYIPTSFPWKRNLTKLTFIGSWLQEICKFSNSQRVKKCHGILATRFSKYQHFWMNFVSFKSVEIEKQYLFNPLYLGLFCGNRSRGRNFDNRILSFKFHAMENIHRYVC